MTKSSANLDTVLMVEDVLSKRHEFASKDKLCHLLPKQLKYKTFNKILEHLEASNKIAYATHLKTLQHIRNDARLTNAR